MIFTLQRFNPIRAARGVGAAEVLVEDGELHDILWMTKRDIQRNIRDFGRHCKGLIDAMEAYRKNVYFDAGVKGAEQG